MNAWSASRPYTPTKQLGGDAEFVSAVSHTIERFTLTTGMRTRQFVRKQLPNGSGYYESPRSVKSYDIWDDVKEDCKRENFEQGLDETTFAVECPTCHGSGKETCPSCDGKGGHQCKRSHIHHKGNMIKCPDSRCQGGRIPYNVHNGVPSGYHTCEKCKGVGYVECPDCHGTLWVTCSRCDGNKEIDCRTCDAAGHLVYEWFVVQKYKEISGRTIWRPKSGLSDVFYALEKLPWASLYDDECEDGRFPARIPAGISGDTAKIMQSVALVDAWEGRCADVDKEIAAFKADANYRTSFEHSTFEQYDGIVEYNYKFDGKNYTAWINLATGAVEECENGLYASIAEDTVRLAQESEKNGIPQDAIYYYCKADAISLKWGKENGTQKRRVRQYRMLGAWFGGAMLVISLLCWLPALCMSGMDILGIGATICGLAAITACMVSLNELIQVGGLALVFGLSYLAHTQFGTAFGEDLIVREGYLISLLAYAWAVVTLTTDQGQRLPGGRKGLLIGGCLAGLVAAPVALYVGIISQSFVKTGGLFVPLLILVGFSLIRLPVRLKAGKMQKFVEKNDGNGEKIRKVIESRKPCKMGAIAGSGVIASLLILTLLGLVLGGPLDTMLGNVHFSLLTTLQAWGIL